MKITCLVFKICSNIIFSRRKRNWLQLLFLLKPKVSVHLLCNFWGSRRVSLCILSFGQFIYGSMYLELSMNTFKFTSQIYENINAMGWSSYSYVFLAWCPANCEKKRMTCWRQVAACSRIHFLPGRDSYMQCSLLCIQGFFFPGITYSSDSENLVQNVLQTNPRGCMYTKIALYILFTSLAEEWYDINYWFRDPISVLASDTCAF